MKQLLIEIGMLNLFYENEFKSFLKQFLPLTDEVKNSDHIPLNSLPCTLNEILNTIFIV